MFTAEQIQAYKNFIYHPTTSFPGSYTTIGALYIIGVITMLIILVTNLVKQKYSLPAYAVIFFTAMGGFVLAGKTLFPFNKVSLWANALQRMCIPFYDTYKYMYCMNVLAVSPALMSTLHYFAFYLFCPMCMSLGAHLLNSKKRVLYPWIITFAICLTDLVMLFYDANKPGDIGIFIVGAAGILLGKLIARGVPQKTKDKMLKKERICFSMSIITAENIYHTYISGNIKNEVITNLDFSVDESEIVSIMGKSGRVKQHY